MKSTERFLIIFFATSLAMLTLLMFTALLMYEEPARNKWCRDQFGTERPMEMCED